jgi:RNA polymerase sigma-70 factor (ECF subfamily)
MADGGRPGATAVKVEDRAMTGRSLGDVGVDDVAELRAYLRRGLRRAISGVSDDDIEDFTQEALVRILRNVDSFKGESRFGTWAMAIAVRVAFSALRRRRHQERAADFDTELVEAAAIDAPGAGDPGRGSERRDVMSTLRRAIHHELSDRQRRAVLGELRGIPSQTLAEQLGMNRNAFYKLHHDARKKLKAAILAAGFSAEDVVQALSGE